jgi:periplasmic protein TonB
MRLSNRSITATARMAVARFRGQLLSVVVHVVLLLAVLGVLHSSYRVAPYRLPGTNQGVRMLTYYSPGSPAHAVSDIPLKDDVKRITAPVPQAAAEPPKLKETAAPSTEAGTGSSPDSGLGEGDIKIALQTYFPYPKPSLSSLPHGTSSDVILDAVIDEHGKIADLKLLKGIGPGIDDVVIATVKQWSFSPATRNGVPIPSEQELHFHYERS